MTDIAQLENETLARIEAADDEAGLEAVRLGALGKGRHFRVALDVGQNVARGA